MVKIKGKPSITLIVTASLLLLLGLWHTARMMAVKYWMEDYLKKEYGKEFVVNKVGYQFSYYGDGLKIKGIAYAKDDPSLKFDIIRVARGGVFQEYPTYGESYIIDLWEKQKREEIKAILSNNIIWAGISSEYKEELYGRTISVKEAEQQFEIRMKRLYITCVLFVDLENFRKNVNEFNNFKDGNLSRKQAKQLFNIIKKLKNQSYETIMLEVRYINDKHKTDAEKHSFRYLKGRVSYFEGLTDFGKGTILCRFLIEDLNHIGKPEDVKRFIDLEYGYLYHDSPKD
jgi:hypothetical protein